MTDDLAAVAAQLGRPLRGKSTVVVRCHLDLPVVIRVGPRLEDGTPFPTLFWLTCPLARRRVGRLEAAGGVASYAERAKNEEAFAKRLARAHSDYQRERDGEVAVMGGVGGAAKSSGVKCLHAHYAHTLAGGSNPIGEEVRGEIEPLDCAVPCVVVDGVNPDWREPRGDTR